MKVECDFFICHLNIKTEADNFNGFLVFFFTNFTTFYENTISCC